MVIGSLMGMLLQLSMPHFHLQPTRCFSRLICIVLFNSPADLVKGWTRHVAYEGIASVDPPNLKKGESLHTSYNIDESVIVDYTAYARSVWPKGQDFFISEVDFYEDGTGQHAVRIELEVGLDEYVDYYLFYDKSNQRTKVMRGNPLHHYYKGGC